MATSNPQSVPLTEAPAVTPRRTHWRALLEAWRRSGLSQTEFCRREGIARRGFSSWKARLAREAGVVSASSVSVPGRPPPRSAFVPVRIVSTCPPRGEPKKGSPPDWDGEIEIALARGQLVRVRGRVDVQGLRQVLVLLEAARC